MSKELNCMNCCIGDFKYSLCDCDNGMCKEYKKIGNAEDFENEVLNRTKRKKGIWFPYDDDYSATTGVKCSECGFTMENKLHNYTGINFAFCPNCGANMKYEEMDEEMDEADLDYERAVMQYQHNLLYKPSFNPEDGSM